VKASHPGAATNPVGQHLPIPQEEFPSVISTNIEGALVAAAWYKRVLTNPTAGNPLPTLQSFIIENTPATSGAEQEVPPTTVFAPFTTIGTEEPIPVKSG